jgi:DNA-binding response OmpR family regulator
VAEAASARELFSAELASAGFMVLEAGDGASAIDKSLRFSPHAIVLDLMLPGIDGFKVARRLRAEEHTSDIVIVAVAALAADKLEAMATAAGCDAFMSKPVPGDVLVAEIVRLLTARRTVEDLWRVTKRR